MNFKKRFFTGILLIMISATAFSQDPNFYVFLALGQSNMQGHSMFESQDTTTNKRFQVLSAVDCPDMGRQMGNWYTAKPPLCRCWSGITPVDYFGKVLVDNLPDSIRIGVINVAVGGCKIELFDEENYEAYMETAPDWLINMAKDYDGNPYGRLVEMAKIAQQSGVIKGILLHQGESNTGDQQWPEKVKGVYENLLSDLNLASENVPLLAGEVVSKEQGGKCASHNDIINTLSQVISNSYVISSAGCEAIEDGLHFSAAGYREIGRRYGEQMLTILGMRPMNQKTKSRY